MNKANYNTENKPLLENSQPKGSSAGNFVVLLMSLSILISFFGTNLITIEISKSDGSFAIILLNNLGKMYVDGNSSYQNLVTYNSGFGIWLFVASIILSIVLAIKCFITNKWLTLLGCMLSLVLIPLTTINLIIMCSVGINATSPANVGTQLNTLAAVTPFYYAIILLSCTGQMTLLSMRQKAEK